MRPCRQCHGTNPTPSNKGLQTAWPEKSEKFREFFFRAQKWFCLRSQQCFFSQKFFAHFFTVLPEVFFAGFSRFFSHIFSHYFSHGFSRRIFRTSLLRIFLTHFFIAVCCPKGFHSLQSQHCVTVPKTGHTTTCRSSPSLLTQYSHKQVEHFKSFWKDKRQIFTLQTIRHNNVVHPCTSIHLPHRGSRPDIQKAPRLRVGGAEMTIFHRSSRSGIRTRRVMFLGFRG